MRVSRNNFIIIFRKIKTRVKRVRVLRLFIKVLALKLRWGGNAVDSGVCRRTDDFVEACFQAFRVFDW